MSLLAVWCSVTSAEEVSPIVRDRAAIERVYYNHRTWTRPPFEDLLPNATLEQLVRQDLKKEAWLKQRYGTTISHELLDAEVQRINSTTRAPEVLAEIKAALGGDPEKFADVFARPILVERLLHERFEADSALHAAARRQCEAARAALLAARSNGADAAQLLALLKGLDSNAVTQTTWQLTARPVEPRAPAADEAEIRKRFGPDAKIISSPNGAVPDRKDYFEDLPVALQKVIHAQLRQSGDISAVIETPRGFLLYLARTKTETALAVACLTLPKRSYEAWLAGQL